MYPAIKYMATSLRRTLVQEEHYEPFSCRPAIVMVVAACCLKLPSVQVCDATKA